MPLFLHKSSRFAKKPTISPFFCLHISIKINMLRILTALPIQISRNNAFFFLLFAKEYDIL
jgi:hypothetical protein